MLSNRIQQLIDRGDVDDALDLCYSALDANPDNIDALWGAGRIFMLRQRPGMSYLLNKHITKLVPGDAGAWNNFSMAAFNARKTDEAEHAARKALNIEPNLQPALSNMALYKVNSCEPELAIQYADRALAQMPGHEDTLESKGYALLQLGKWGEGWDHYESTIKGRIRKWRPFHKEPYWDGTKGVSLHIRGEQGVGDEIAFASVLPDVHKDCRIVFECDRRLEGLFKRSFPDMEIHGTRFDAERNWGGKFEYSCLAGSLCRHYRREAKDFPGTPYLVADPERRLQWRTLLDTFHGKKVGIAWSGGSQSTFIERRTLKLEDLKPILDVPNCTFISLQYRKPGNCADYGIKHWARAVEAGVDYDETAALVAELDLVICATTAVAHLAGALGRPCWVMAPNKPRWFYGLKGDSIPWYKSVKIYRQTSEWPIKQIAQDLASL